LIIVADCLALGIGEGFLQFSREFVETHWECSGSKLSEGKIGPNRSFSSNYFALSLKRMDDLHQVRRD
jgi:hypothetical protein